MADTILETEKPSQSEAFAENVLARVLREFQQQEKANPQTADRGLLDEGREALFQILGNDRPLEDNSIRNGFLLLWRRRDWVALSTLLMRYLRQPLSDSEVAWAYLHLADAIALSGSAAGAVLAHEAFERWMPGRTPLLSAQWPFYPVTGDTRNTTYADNEVRLLFLANVASFPVSYWNQNVGHNKETPEFITSFLKAWYTSDFLAKVDTMLSDVPGTQCDHRLRFLVLQRAANACVSIGNLDATQRYVQQMHYLAEHSEDEAVRVELKTQALGQEIHLAQRRQNKVTFIERVTELVALLNSAALMNKSEPQWLKGQRQALAIVLMRGDRHDLALPLWEANEASGGQANGWGWLMYAATLWQMTQDRERTLALLREARAHDDRDMVPLFVERPEFAGVQDDPEFRQAIGRK